MPYDVQMTQGDNVLSSTGNYEHTTTSLPKMLRCVMAAYGRWPAGPCKIGNEAWVAGRRKASDADLESIRAEFKEALQPLVEEGLIRDVEVTRVSSLRADSPRWRISAWDNRAQDTVEFETSSAWGT